jgi:hypothetical protein
MTLSYVSELKTNIYDIFPYFYIFRPLKYSTNYDYSSIIVSSITLLYFIYSFSCTNGLDVEGSVSWCNPIATMYPKAFNDLLRTFLLIYEST